MLYFKGNRVKQDLKKAEQWLNKALDQEYISQTTFQEIYDQALKTIKIIDGLIRYLRSTMPNKNKSK